MEKAINWINDKLVPPLNRFSTNIWLSSLSESFVLILPLILVGTLITVISALGEYVTFLPNLQPISDFSMGLMGLFTAFLYPHNILQKKGIENGKMLGGFLSVSLYFMLTLPVFDADGFATLEFGRLGAGGIFVAIATGAYTAILMNLFLKNGFFSKSKGIPSFISTWFDALLPIFLVMLTGWIISGVLRLDAFQLINILVAPLLKSSQTFWGFVLLNVLTAVLYGFGVSTWWTVPLIFSMMVPAMAENVALVAQGMAPVNIHTSETLAAWIWLGGTGCTLPIGIMACFSKSKMLKLVGRTSLVPHLININEPVMFGLPVILNPILMIPLFVNSLVISVITYLTLAWGFVTIPFRSFLYWYAPLGVSAYIVNGDWRGIVLVVVLVLVAAVIWYPFFKVYERQMVQKELAAEREAAR